MTKEEYKNYLESRKKENEDTLEVLASFTSLPSLASEVVIGTILIGLANDNIYKELYLIDRSEER